jgi:RNA polymerase sigma-70 factor, ECF subfamily
MEVVESPQAHMFDPDDESLLRAAVDDDSRAFEELIRRYDRDLRILATRIVGWTATDDVLQEAYLKAYRASTSFRRKPGSVRGWLFRIVYSCSIDWLRRSRRHTSARSVPSPADIEARAPAPDELVAGRDEVERALAALPVEERAAVILVDGLGFDYASASEILEVPNGTLASRLHRARQFVRNVIDESRGEEAHRHETH